MHDLSTAADLIMQFSPEETCCITLLIPASRILLPAHAVHLGVDRDVAAAGQAAAGCGH